MAYEGNNNFKSQYHSSGKGYYNTSPYEKPKTFGSVNKTSWGNSGPNNHAPYPKKQNSFNSGSRYNNQPGVINNQKIPKGKHHLINFGKYRCLESPTWYTVANNRDFNYLRWCLNTDKIELDPTTKSHIVRALELENDPKALWVETREQDKENPGFYHLVYSADINGNTQKSSVIDEKLCVNCKKYLLSDYFKADPDMCFKCCRALTLERCFDD